MKFVPFLFNTDMVTAILSGQKTETRRIKKTDQPKAQVGDVIWVRETFAHTDSSINIDPGYVYKATDPDWKEMEGFKWKPSIFMPKDACRIFLKVTAVKTEPLQAITQESAENEGIKIDPEGLTCWDYLNKNYQDLVPKDSFKTLWQSINGLKSWDLNPDVFAYTFEQIDKPLNFK